VSGFIAETVRGVIERARTSFWAFNDVQMPDGALLQIVNDRQRSAILAIIEHIQPLIGETLAVTIGTSPDAPQALVAFDGSGAPYFTTTVEDGYGIRFADGVPYIDTTRLFVSDPFGASGTATPGFPLQADILRIIACTVSLSTDQTFDPPHTVDILDQVAATQSGAGHGGGMAFKAFISARRLVPVRQTMGDAWSLVTELQISTVRCPVLTTLDDTLTIPEPFTLVLESSIAEFLAGASPKCTDRDRQRFMQLRREAQSVNDSDAFKVLDAVTSQSVLYRR